MIFIALALLPAALACGAGTGPITANPTMSFNYSSPLGWTWNTATLAVGGQSISETMAVNRIKMDIESAVMNAVTSYGYSTAGIEVRNAVKSENIEVSAAGACDKAFGQEDGAVTKVCVAATPTLAAGTLHSIVSSINVNSPIALAESNWENIATKVWASLTANAGVKFHGLITVRV